LLRISGAFFEMLEDFKEYISVDSDLSPTDTGTEQATREALRGRVQEAQEACGRVGFEMLEDEGGAAGGGIRLNYEGPWSVECFKLLGADLEPYTGVARVMDETRFQTVVDVVEALNAGVTEVEDGFCIAWSEIWQQYYMLFQKDKEQTAMQLLEQTAKEVAARQKREQFLKMQQVVIGAIGAADVEKWREAVVRRQESMTQRIRKDVKGELEASIQERADALQERAEAELMVQKAVAWEQARGQIAEAEAGKTEVLAQKARMEAGYKEKILNLERELKTMDARKGAYGELPQLYTQLTDDSARAAGLRSAFQDLRDHLAAGIADVKEALCHCDALDNNPDTLPGLSELLEVLFTFQRRHTESEKLCTQLRLAGQLQVLKDVRDQMAQVGSRLERIAKGVVTIHKGLEPELVAIREELNMVAKWMGILEQTFNKWNTRLERAVELIDQAKVCADIRTEDVPMPPNTAKGLWGRLFTGVLENFCIHERPLRAREGQVPRPRPHDLGPGVLGLKKVKKTFLTLDGAHAHVRRPRKAKHKFHKGEHVALLPTKQARGVVRFTGETKFSAGEWIGVELDSEIGKNDGSVNGLSYFRCKPYHGIFVRPEHLVTDTYAELAYPSRRSNVHEHCVAQYGKHRHESL